MADANNNTLRSVLLYALLAVTGTLISYWGWWATMSINGAALERATTIAEWSTWRGQTTEKLEGMKNELRGVRVELEEIKVYLRARGWKQRQEKKAPVDNAPKLSDTYPATSG